MGPLQYMVVGFEAPQFKQNILPEIRALCDLETIRVRDLVFVSKDANGKVSSMELDEALPDGRKDMAEFLRGEDLWFEKEDVELAGEYLPDDSVVALILFEHVWSLRLDAAVKVANENLESAASTREIANVIEYRLTVRD
jgi:hypothetical protein